MSFILDALRRVERDKRLALQPAIDIKDRLLSDRERDDGGFLARHSREAVIISGLFAFAGGLWYLAGALDRQSSRAETAPAPAPVAAKSPAYQAPAAPAVVTTVTPVSQAVVEPDDIPVVDLSVKRMPVRTPAREGRPRGRGKERVSVSTYVPASETESAESVSGLRGIEEEVSSRIPPGYAPQKNRKSTAGSEPPGLSVQAAPAPVFNLDGIIFHSVAANRSALIGAKGTPSALVKIGDTVAGYTVEDITQNRVTLASAGRKVNLSLE